MPERPPLSSFEPPEQRLQKLPQRPPLESFDQMSGKIKSESSLMSDVGTFAKDVGIGLGRAAAGTYGSLPRMGLAGTGRINPEGSMQPAAKAFAAEPSTSVAQTVGEIAGNTLPYMMLPEIGVGRAAIQYGVPAGLTAAALAKVYMTHGVMGIVNAAAAAGMGKLTLNRYLPHLLQLAKTHAATVGRTLGGPLEKVGLGAATTAARQGEANGKDQ